MKLKSNQILLLIVLSCSIIFSQQKGEITGNVIDATTKESLIGVNLIIEGTSFGAATDVNGNFRIKNIPVGNYNIKASFIGFNSVVKTDVMVVTSKPVYLEIELKESEILLDGVTVTSDYYEAISTEPVSVRRFNYEELRRTPGGFEDVVRALSVIPGVAKQSAGRNDLVVRGGAPSENLYLLDGFVVPNINHFATQGASGGTNSYVDLDFVDNTTFSTGGFSVKYGDKLSSVLGIDLREGRKDKVGGKALISASQFGLNLEGPILGNDDFIFSVRRSYLDFIFNAAGFSFVPQYYDMLGKYNYRIDNSNKLSFLFVGALDDVIFNNNNQEDIVDNARILSNSQKQYTAGISFRHLFNKGFIDVRFGRNFVDYDSFQKDTLLNPIFTNKSTEATNNLSADLIYKLNKSSEINIGAGYDLVQSKNEIFFPKDFITSFGDTLPVNNLIQDENFHKANAYMLYNTTVFNRLSLNLGLRGDYFNAIDEKFTLSPRVSLQYILNQKININFSTGRYYQSPSYIWLAYPGNNRIKSAKVDQYILGLDYLPQKDTQVKLEGFYKNYTDYAASNLRNYIVLANAGAGFGGAEENFSSFGLEPLESKGTGFSRGLELSVQKKASDSPLYGIGSLTYSETKFTSVDNIERKGQYNQNWIVNLSAGYMLDNTWIFSGKFRLATGFPYTPIYNFGMEKKEEYLTKTLPVTNSLDLRVDKIWYFDSFTLVTYLDVQNVYNNKNINGYRWDYNENKIVEQKEFGILPTIGVSLEF